MRSPSGPQQVSDFEMVSIGVLLQQLAKERGGSCVAIWKEGILALTVQGMRPAEIYDLIDIVIGSFVRAGKLVETVQLDSIPIQGGKLPNYAGPHSLIREKLTKKLLVSLPEEAFVVSNLRNEEGRPVFAEKVSPVRTRSQQWRRVIAAGANGGLCEVVWTEANFYSKAAG